MTGEELFYGVNRIEIADSNYDPSVRVCEYLNLVEHVTFANNKDDYDFTQTSISHDEVIHMRYFMMTNKGKLYERKVTQVLEEFSDVGGLTETLIVVGFVFYVFFIQPFQHLHLAVCHNKLKDQICR